MFVKEPNNHRSPQKTIDAYGNDNKDDSNANDYKGNDKPNSEQVWNGISQESFAESE